MTWTATNITCKIPHFSCLTFSILHKCEYFRYFLCSNIYPMRHMQFDSRLYICSWSVTQTNYEQTNSIILQTKVVKYKFISFVCLVENVCLQTLVSHWPCFLHQPSVTPQMDFSSSPPPVTRLSTNQ